MKIFKDEKDIEDKIQAGTSIAYVMDIKKDVPKIQKFTEYKDKKLKSDIEEIVNASIKDSELYYHSAILVTTSWNLNDDVFMPGVVWAARNTPVHKPTNLGHDSTKIIGHMTGSWAIDTDGNQIAAEEITELPSKFHILVGSVIYKVWPSDENYEKNIEELIAQIEDGKKFVSMECQYKNFDYAIASDDGLKIVSRNKDTSFLSKYLRAYDGPGEFQGQKIGRAVKEISFCGKGYVDKPANPESVIFTKEQIFDFATAKIIEKFDVSEKIGVILNTDEKSHLSENKIMTEFYKEQNDELKAQNISLAKSLDEIKEKLTQSNVSKLEKDIEQLTAQVNDMTVALKKKSDEVSAKELANAELAKKSEELVTANDELIKTNKEATEKLNKIEAENKTTLRISTLVAGGFTKEQADEKVKIFTALSDEQFNAVAQEMIEAKKHITKSPENPEGAKATDLDDAEVKETDKKVTSASVETDELDVSDLAKKLSAELKTKDGDK